MGKKDKDTTVCIGYAGGYAQMILNLDDRMDRWTITKQSVSESYQYGSLEYENDQKQPTETFPTLELAMLWAAQEINQVVSQ